IYLAPTLHLSKIMRTCPFIHARTTRVLQKRTDGIRKSASQGKELNKLILRK
ncbi:hypothetical protein SERLA73DRAFT_141437, partial [Serpula lacrymans var. lacrymans S7.3]